MICQWLFTCSGSLWEVELNSGKQLFTGEGKLTDLSLNFKAKAMIYATEWDGGHRSSLCHCVLSWSMLRPPLDDSYCYSQHHQSLPAFQTSPKQAVLPTHPTPPPFTVSWLCATSQGPLYWLRSRQQRECHTSVSFTVPSAKLQSIHHQIGSGPLSAYSQGFLNSVSFIHLFPPPPPARNSKVNSLRRKRNKKIQTTLGNFTRPLLATLFSKTNPATSLLWWL